MRSWPPAHDNQPPIALAEDGDTRRFLRRHLAAACLLTASWLLLGPLPRCGWQFVEFIAGGINPNVWYYWKLGVLGYGYLMHLQYKGQVAVRIFSFDIGLFVASIAATCCLWLGYFRTWRLHYKTGALIHQEP